ncbi:MAG: hypothetical protein K8R53_04595, partial [Bacteroidales bacterium]|nr:hypothetical protein [Bacteroidales bacterium]
MKKVVTILAAVLFTVTLWAQSGTAYYVSTGNYGEDYMWPGNSETTDNPSVFEGYRNTPGDIPDSEPFDIYREGGLPAPEFDRAEMPVIQGIIIDHTCEELSNIPMSWIDSVQEKQKWHYAHTSHGGQLT